MISDGGDELTIKLFVIYWKQVNNFLEGVIMDPIFVLLLGALLMFGFGFLLNLINRKKEKFSTVIDFFAGTFMFASAAIAAVMIAVGILALSAFLTDFLIHF
jgi:hypothetical protein